MLTRGFIKLLKRYKEGTLPGRMKDTIDVWYNSIHKDPVEKNGKEEIGKRIWLGIIEGREYSAGYDLPPRPARWWKKGIWKVAAVLILAGTAFYFSGTGSSERSFTEEVHYNTGTNWLEDVNNGSMAKDIFLPDGSKVTLEPGARLRHPQSFDNDSRVVYLEGNGFFDVTKDPARPFMAYSGAVLTRVLGTSFSIRSIAETGGTEVAVITGKVIVEKSGAKKQGAGDSERENRIVLTPNKKVTFFSNSDHYVTGLVENPVMVPGSEKHIKPGDFNFDETPLSEVLGKLEKAYGVEITLSEDKMLDCPVTADVSSENLYGKMEIIGAVLNAKYEITGSSILLSGGGCGGPSRPDSKP